jgi:hypothetical protein
VLNAAEVFTWIETSSAGTSSVCNAVSSATWRIPSGSQRRSEGIQPLTVEKKRYKNKIKKGENGDDNAKMGTDEGDGDSQECYGEAIR